ncbi:MAG: serine/threonine protein kinase [Acidobacteria bacterium]|nr:serine/threonine protein kinase [Acidobacteriota bacterium]
MPTPAVRESRRTTGLPDELVSEQIQRLALFAAIAAGLWAVGLIIDVVLVPLTWGVEMSWRAVALDLGGIGSAAWMYWLARYCRQPGRTKADISLIYLVLNAIAIAILNTWIVPPLAGPSLFVSWAAPAILIFAMIAPVSPQRILIASLVAASMDPLAMLVAYLLGTPVVSVPQAILRSIPNYTCAVVAMLPSRVLYRLGRRLREAQELGSYQLVELLGHGGMGEVWRARHQLLARQAAIKLVRPEVLGARDEAEARVLLRRFEREAQATAALSSPHTIQLFDFGMTGEGTFYYVMELLAGRDLETLVREFGPVPADRSVFLLRQVCHSLADAHARGMVHRDIKPANVYVCRMGLEYDFVKVLDFGLVKVRDRAATADTLLTVDHTTTGTPAYMAPEIILGEADVDSRADVYALGCVAYYLLTGSLVFEAETPMKMLLQHAHAKPVPPSQRTELPIPRELDELVLACLEKDPNDRPQSAEDLFRLAVGCPCNGWNQASARSWWKTHLPELTGPLVVPEDTQHAGRVVVTV